MITDGVPSAAVVCSKSKTSSTPAPFFMASSVGFKAIRTMSALYGIILREFFSNNCVLIFF
jgi:hypothetical protein